MAAKRDHNKLVPLNRVGRALGRLRSSLESLQRKIARFPRGEMLVVVTCTKKNRRRQEAEEWTLFSSGALERAVKRYMPQIQQAYLDILEEGEQRVDAEEAIA